MLRISCSVSAIYLLQRARRAYILVGVGIFVHVGDALAQAVREARITQRKLAKLSGTSPSQVSRYLRGRALPTLEVLERLLEPLGVSVLDFAFNLAWRSRLPTPMKGSVDRLYAVPEARDLVSEGPAHESSPRPAAARRKLEERIMAIHRQLMLLEIEALWGRAAEAAADREPAAQPPERQRERKKRRGALQEEASPPTER